MLNRRTLLSLPIFSIPFFNRVSTDSKHGLGKYKKHRLQVQYDLFPWYPMSSKYTGEYRIEFPAEGILTVKYEKGEEEYQAFNVKPDDLSIIHHMPIKKIVKTYNHPNDWEHSYIILDYKFQLASILTY